MTVLDWFLLGAGLLALLAGWRRGFLVGVLALAGLVAGSVGGLLLAPIVVSGIDSPGPRSAAAIGIVLVAAAVGQGIGSMLGMWLRRQLSWRPVRTLDSLLGAGVGVAALALGVWVLAATLRSVPVPEVASAVRSSRVIDTLDRAVPYAGQDLTSQLRGVLDDRGFPEVFRGITEPLIPVDPPDPLVADTPGIAQAAASIVRVDGAARSCSRQIEGTGFVVAPGRVMTNAHVVAGVRQPVVRIGGVGEVYPATVVLFDPARDVAVLAVPDLRAKALPLAPVPARRGDAAVVAGFPLGGPYELDSARVSSRLRARGSDIYDARPVVRDVYAVSARVRPGNSGGPLLSTDGAVLGMVFAASVDTPDTGYALSLEEILPDVDAAAGAGAEVATGRCA